MVLPVKIARGHGVLEFWSNGNFGFRISELKNKLQIKVFNLKSTIPIQHSQIYNRVAPPLHYSGRLRHEGKTIKSLYEGGSKPPWGFFIASLTRLYSG
jgi:hypothetical protein